MATVTLRLTPQRAHVRTARLVAAAMARRSGVSEELLDEVRLAIGEACGRAVQLHERHGLTEPVVVTLVDGDRFEVTVQDAAPVAGQHTSQAARGSPDRAADAADTADPPRPEAGKAVPASSGSHQHDGGDGAAAQNGNRGGSAVERSADANQPVGPAKAWEEPLDTGLGLALLDALVEDITVEATGSTPGTRVRMSWPIDRPAADGPDQLASSPAG